MKSMTGYALRENDALSVEIKGYNSRYLDLCLNVPAGLSALEPELKELLSSRCRRGKVEMTLRVKSRAAPAVTVNRETALACYRALEELAAALGLEEKPTLSQVLAQEGVLEIGEIPGAVYEALREEALSLATQAAAAFAEEREREGRHTEADILCHVAALEKAREEVAAQAPALEKAIKENLRSRFAEVLGDAVDAVEENRVLAETAVLLMKYTISEELFRLSAHLAEFRAETARNPSPGKKLDFLCQEINREVNTIGSKTPVLDVSLAVVTMKDELENIREQLRNVE